MFKLINFALVNTHWEFKGSNMVKAGTGETKDFLFGTFHRQTG